MSSDGCIEAHGIPDCPEAVKQMYDQTAHEYEDFVVTRGYSAYKRASEIVAEFVPDRNAEILDLCAGTGMAGEVLNKLGYKNLSAHDGSSKMLKMAKRKNVYKRFHEELLYEDKMPLTLPANHFDVILCCASFLPGHLTSSHIPNLVKLLKSSGILVILTRQSSFHETTNQADHISEDEKAYMRENSKVLQTLLASDESGVEMLREETSTDYGFNKAGIIMVLGKSH